MIVDNRPANPEVKDLPNVTVKFLPTNATSVLQPLHQEIIKKFKTLYRKLLLAYAAANSDDFQSINCIFETIKCARCCLMEC
jgi:hypothetical protein